MHDSERRVCGQEGGTNARISQLGKMSVFAGTCCQAAAKLRRAQGTAAGAQLTCGRWCSRTAQHPFVTRTSGDKLRLGTRREAGCLLVTALRALHQTPCLLGARRETRPATRLLVSRGAHQVPGQDFARVPQRAGSSKQRMAPM